MGADVPELRLSDAERQEAMDALSEHVRTGRLDMDEFGDRSAKVAAARLRGDLAPLFGDLPEPHPSVLDAIAPPPPAAGSTRGGPPSRLAAGVLPVAAILAVALFFVIRSPVVFLLPVAAAFLAGSAVSRRRR